LKTYSIVTIGDREIKVNGNLIKIGRIHGDTYKFLDDPEPLLNAIRKDRKGIDLFTFMQRLPASAPKFNYPMELDNVAALRITTFDDWFTKQIDGKTRNMVRRAEKKGIVIREVPFGDELVRGIQEIYNESPVRQGKPFWHYNKPFERLYKEEGTHLDTSVFIGAYLEEKLIGFIKLVFDETWSQAGTLNILSMMAHRDKAPTNALIAQAVKSCADRNASYLVYANFSYGVKEHDSLSAFKSNNGFEKIDLPRYYVPMSPLGRIAYRLGLHHGYRGFIPASAESRLREWRNSWYNRKLQTKEQHS